MEIFNLQLNARFVEEVIDVRAEGDVEREVFFYTYIYILSSLVQIFMN